MISSVFIGSGFAICGLVMMLLILIIFLNKNKKWDMKSTIFFITAIVTIIVLSLEIIISYTIINRDIYPTLNNILCRFYMFFNILWFFLATGYVISVFVKFDKNKKEIYFSIIYGVISILCSVLFAVLYNLSFDVYIEGEPCFIDGSYYIIMKVISILSSSTHVLIMTLNRKKVKNLKMASIFFLAFAFLVANVILYLIGKDLNILSITLALTITILFLTIENQDIKLLDEYENMRKESIKSSEAKSDFLVNMSHEIRTPLTTILGFSQTLLYNDNLTEEMLKKDLISIKKANNSLTSLINSLSDISSLENNKVVLSESDYSLENLIFEIYSYIPPKINKENLMFNIKVNPDIPKKYYGDAAKLFKAISYIIQNAIEHTNYGEVTLTVDAHKKEHANYELEFIVSNTGHAMKEDEFNLNLDDYIELSDKANNASLGLIIAKRLIMLCNGTIEFINRPGEGTKYIIKVNQKNYTEDEKIGNIFANHTHTNFTSNFINCKDKRVLIVDDKVSNLSVMTEYLENYKFTIVTAKNGKDAIAAIQRERFDIVFLDYLMPDMSGVDVIKTLKSLLQVLPVMVLVVNNSESSDFDKFIQEGFNDCITKPIIFKNLNKLINKYFKEE
ncbi:MAG: response regulator [bacterium]|nr:response regulator [bacterium]